MNFRTTIVLLILLLVVGGYLMFTGGKTDKTAALQSTNPKRLLDISSNDVSKVILTPAGGTAIVLERHTSPAAAPTLGPAQSDWKLVKPYDAYADASKVSDLIDAVVGSTSTAQVNIGSSAADYGLDAPQYTIDLEAGPKSARLDVGRQVKAGNELYVHVEGKDVAEVISADLLEKLDTTAEKLRLAKLVNADATSANWISLQRPKDPLVLEKDGGQWQMTLPTTRPGAAATTQPAEQSVVSDLITAVGNAQAVGFAQTSDDASLLIGTPRATVVIGAKPPSTQPADQETIEFGTPDSLLGKNVWVRVMPPGVLAKVSKETMDSILKSPLDLRNRQVAQIDPASVKEIRIVKNIPATTQPIAIGARTHQIVLTRRPPKKVSVIAGPPAPTTRGLATQASTQPDTLPVVAAATQPSSVWELTGTVNPSDADDSKVDAALANFNPLRADKYLPSLPATSSGQTTFFVTLTTDKGEEDFTFSDAGVDSTDPTVGVHNDMIFNLPRATIASLDGEFIKSVPTKP